MLFPESKRVLYARNPLVEVICQLRFPEILRLRTEVPVEFQELIREKYPLYQQPSGIDIEGLPKDAQRVVSSFFREASGNHQFLTEDSTTFVTLAPSFLALTTHSYSRYEDFRLQLEVALKALVGIYRPAFYTRIGLRYKDEIRPHELGLSGVKWTDLLAPGLIGELASQVIADAAIEVRRFLLLKLPDIPGEYMRIVHGLADIRDPTKATYTIDTDLYIDQKVEVGDEGETIARFNRTAGNFFRWAIQERLHEAFGPIPL